VDILPGDLLRAQSGRGGRQSKDFQGLYNKQNNKQINKQTPTTVQFPGIPRFCPAYNLKYQMDNPLGHLEQIPGRVRNVTEILFLVGTGGTKYITKEQKWRDL